MTLLRAIKRKAFGSGFKAGVMTAGAFVDIRQEQIEAMFNSWVSDADVTREQLGEMIYRATYEHQGGMWLAVETKDFWYETADRLIALLNPKPTPITSFSGEYRWLSNFWPAPVMLDGVTYPTVEHAYQAAKTHDPSIRWHFQHEKTPGDAKRLGRSIQLRDDWESVKVPIMSDLVWLKFQHPDLRRKLIDTAGRDLVEGNSWGDTFWGDCNGVGSNMLGQILMNVRDHLMRAEQPT